MDAKAVVYRSPVMQNILCLFIALLMVTIAPSFRTSATFQPEEAVSVPFWHFRISSLP